MDAGSRASSSTDRRTEVTRLKEPTGDPTQEHDAPQGSASPALPGSVAPPVDLGRRGFFRAFAGELFQTAATVAGAAQALQRASAEAASAILDPASASLRVDEISPDASAGQAPTGFRTPFREGDSLIYVIDQRKLPDALVQVEVTN